MDIYYIVTNNGFMKGYYSEKTSSIQEGVNKDYSFSPTIRNATSFSSVETAKNKLLEKEIQNCLIVDHNGTTQSIN